VEYEIDAFARRTDLSIDTIRYYQTLGLLHAPRRAGRRAVYDGTHLQRIERIQSLSARGVSLKGIADLLAHTEVTDSDQVLLAALERESAASHYAADEVATRLDIPRTLLAALERSGLVDSETGDPGRGRVYTDADLEVGKGAVKLLRYGFPITQLLGLALKHDRAVRKTVDAAIDLFDAHVRKASPKGHADPEAVAEAFRDLLPVVTALVAHHFQRVLVNRALKRLKKSGDRGDLHVALEETKRSRLKLRWS